MVFTKGVSTEMLQLQGRQPNLYGTVPRKRSLPLFGVVAGDVLEIMASLRPGQTFDVIIADPPYNIGKDFGVYTDLLPLDAYLEWTHEWVAACRERLSPGGLLYVYGLPEILARVAAHFEIQQQRWLQWHYTNKAVASSRFWQRSHESILCLWRTDEQRPSLEIDQIREPYTAGYLNGAAGKQRRTTPSRYAAEGRPTVYGAHPAGALPRDVIKVPALAGGAGAAERWFVCRDCGGGTLPPADLNKHRGHDTLKHPTQKPMALTERLIRSRVNGSGGSVLIPFAGSGSECVVAQNLGLDFLGIEINPEYVALANGWLKKER